MRAPVCERRWTPVRGPGRGSRDSFVRSVAVRPNAEGGGLARRPGARVRDEHAHAALLASAGFAPGAVDLVMLRSLPSVVRVVV